MRCDPEEVGIIEPCSEGADVYFGQLFLIHERIITAAMDDSSYESFRGSGPYTNPLWERKDRTKSSYDKLSD